MKITVGFWVQRDGGIAKVVGVDETMGSCRAVVGWAANRFVRAWHINGRHDYVNESNIDLIKPYVEPRDYWLCECFIHRTKELAEASKARAVFAAPIIHLREVPPNE